MAARYGANTFVDTPEALRSLDRRYWYTAWRRATTAYGPLWELLSVGVAGLSGTRLLWLAIGLKLTALLGWLLVSLAITLAARPGERLIALLPEAQARDLVGFVAASLFAGAMLVAGWLAARRPHEIDLVCATLLLWLIIVCSALHGALI